MSTRNKLVALLKNAPLAGVKVTISIADSETQVYTLERSAGAGAKGITWKANDRFGTSFAIKFVPKDEYSSHSIDAELSKARNLEPGFAQIRWYGAPKLDCKGFEYVESDAIAVVIDWVNGITLREFCSREAESLAFEQFLEIVRQLCEFLAELKDKGLSHSDLHDENIMVVSQTSHITGLKDLHVKIIDTGSLMTNEFHMDLLKRWQDEITTLSRISPSSAEVKLAIEELGQRTKWFSRSDQEWVVSHMCTLLNVLRRNESRLTTFQRRFIKDITPLVVKMVDPDLSMRLDHPIEMFKEIEILWKTIVTPASPTLLTPFDLISAELIRNNNLLNSLFSDKCPWLESCATTDPVYIYGPRGCGKSTILRKLSISAVLASPDAKNLFVKWPYIGVYISCSSELRSRFWLFPKDQYPNIQADAVLFFILLLVEGLLSALEHLRDSEITKILGVTVGLTRATEESIAKIVCARFAMAEISPKMAGVSWLAYVKRKLAIKRNELWMKLLTNPSAGVPNPALLFDICKDLEEVFPLLKQKHIAFLIDDYSNQRIPVELQRMLNQTISFAKQGNPIFKVSSEYQGVDLEGIQEGREVIEVNFGKEYVDVTESKRSLFLEDVLNIRFRESKIDTTIETLLGRSGVSPGLPMAREIRRTSVNKEEFYYNGIDTIADICSGDLAMALGLVKKIYSSVKDKAQLKERIPPAKQDSLIREYSDLEHTYTRYLPQHGREIAEIADSLCWLAHEAAVQSDSNKDGKREPMIKTHIDIPLRLTEELPEAARNILREMQRKGVLFCLDTSRSRLRNDGTERYQVRRILLVRYKAPLGRRDPIKIDNMQRLLHLLQDPRQFVQSELKQQGVLL
jgi:serine/threonine protein kinase